tara:strand:+ start:626 stop:1477 length:852 start_codon:yes stop_codon:yes gene_type:complete
MNTDPTSVSLWVGIANTISALMIDDPLRGFFVVLLSMGVFFGLLFGTSSVLMRVLRSKRKPSQYELFHKERYALNVVDMIRDLQDFNHDRDKLSRDCEKRKERTVPMEQASLARSVIDFLRSSFLLKVSDLIRDIHPDDNNLPDDYDEYRDYQNALGRVMDEVTKMFDGVARENHLAEKTTVELQSYIDYKLNNLKTLIRRVFESYYVSPVLPLKTIMSTYDQDWNESENHYRKLFVDMRAIALKHKQEIETQEQEYNTKWSLFIQNLPERLIKNVLTLTKID